MMEWISVKDRVPETNDPRTNEKVLAYSETNGIEARTWYRGCKMHYTHWMPLPDPPEVEE
jgi:hypothetical protein